MKLYDILYYFDNLFLWQYLRANEKRAQRSFGKLFFAPADAFGCLHSHRMFCAEIDFLGKEPYRFVDDKRNFDCQRHGGANIDGGVIWEC